MKMDEIARLWCWWVGVWCSQKRLGQLKRNGG